MTGHPPSNETRSHKIVIHTPEGVSFSLPLAGPFSRFLAWLLDVLCIMVAVLCIMVANTIISKILSAFAVIHQDLYQAVSILLYFVLSIGYAMALEWYWHGQTLGKRVVGLRVMDTRGLRLRPGQIIIRNLLRAVDALPLCYLLGGIVCLISKHGQRLGDLAGNTIVTRTNRLPEPRIDRILGQARYNSLREHPHLVARLRQRVAAGEADLALRALARRDELDPKARVALFNSMAGLFKNKVAFPEETVLGVSDERYVSNVVDILFRK
jgi:uncharacterized RDD family membrane protein YckC